MSERPTPQLTEDEVKRAYELLERIRNDLKVLAEGDAGRLFAYRRKIAKELTYDERGKPAKRKRLKVAMYKLQDGKCAEHGGEMPLKGSILDRKSPIKGYTKENVELICRACDEKRQWTVAVPEGSPDVEGP
jgi:hypothetical protein